MTHATRTTQIETRRGLSMPALGLGTWQLEGEACARAVRHGLDLGYRHLDTAQMYGNEEKVGEGIRQSGVPRREIFLTTKVWWEHLEPTRIIETTRESLHRLGTDYVDLLLIHWPNDDVPLGDSLQTLGRLRQMGVARHLGVSNFTPKLLAEALDQADIACLQVEYHPFLDQSELLEMARENDLALTAYSPLARGEVMDDATLREIADRHDKSAAQVTLRWLVQQSNVAAIPKASSPEHRVANFEIWDFSLSEDEMETISDLAEGRRLVDPEFAPKWRQSA